MPTFDDAIADSEQARLALRRLAHATRNIECPGDAYQVIGSLLDGLRSLQQVLDQLGTVHAANVRRARGEDRDHGTGVTEVHITAAALHRAARGVCRTQAGLEVALQHSGRIVWSDQTPVIGDGARRRGLYVAAPRNDGGRQDPGPGL